MKFSTAVFCCLLLPAQTSPAFANTEKCPQLEKIKLAMEITAANIANATTTRTPAGGPYRLQRLDCKGEDCQVVAELKVRKVYQTDHPDADANGYVLFPKVSLTTEKAKMNRLIQQYESTSRSCQ